MNDNFKHENQEGNARKQILTALLATVPTFTYGIQIGWLSPMKKLLMSQEPSITDSDISWMAAALPLAAICGIPFFSFASDKFGRKLCIVLVSLLSCISWILKLSMIRPSALIAARAVAGLAAGGCFVVVPVYIKEIAADTWRGALASLVMTVCKVGVIFVYGVGMATSYTTNQSLYLALAGVHAFVFLFMPESPNFLLKIGKEKRAAKTISWLRNVKISSNIVSDEITRMKNDQRTFEEMPKLSLLSVVRDHATFSAVRMTLTLMGVQTLSGCFALMNYASGVFSRAGAPWSPDALAVVMASLQLAGSFFTTISIEKFGRKIPLCVSSGVVCACMCVLGARAGAGAAVGGVCGALLAYGAGLAPVPMVLMAEVFSFQYRARMAGVSMSFSFLCSSATVLLYAPLARLFGEHVVFFVFATVAGFGVLYTVLWVPETKGKSLEEIQRFWNKRPDPEFV